VKDGKSIGYITSGGFAHHVKKSVAYSYLDEKILKLNSLSIVELDHNELEFLQLKGLLDKELIKPLYLS